MVSSSSTTRFPVGRARRSRPTRWRLHLCAGVSQPVLLVVSAALLVIAGIIFFFSTRSSSTPKSNRLPHEAHGVVAAEETSKLIGGKGKLIVVIFNPAKGFLGEQDIILNSFKNSARQHGLEIVGTEMVDFGPHILQGQPAISANQYADWMQRDTADVVVSFVGAPALTPEQAAAVGQRRVKFVSLGAFCPATPEMLSARVVDLAILPVTDLVPSGSETGSVRDCFNRYYRLVTPDSVPR